MLTGRHPRGCLFCLKHDGGFLAREHMLPEGIGGDAFVLPPGWVCDDCNHGALAQLDQALLNLPPIAFARLHLGKPLKGDRPPSVKWQNAEGTFNRDEGVVVLRSTQKPRGWLADDGQTAKIILRERE